MPITAEEARRLGLKITHLPPEDIPQQTIQRTTSYEDGLPCKVSVRRMPVTGRAYNEGWHILSIHGAE